MRRSIQKKAKFDMMDLNTIKVAKCCFVPVLLGHAIDDDIIWPHHSDSIFDAYTGDKNIIKFEGDHNSPRPLFYFDSVNIFFHNVLQPPEDEVGGETIWTTCMITLGGWRNLHEHPDDCESSFVSKVPSDIPSKVEHSEHEGEKFNGDQSPSSSNMITFDL
ncbi:alpha/beta-Hydrolases superfamily protein [Quillaja saponaria]|uniref:Alpha/beta-Hydrolases superfamily protein n=1 Tax=Quillaja saponaria TaxID=32244 RepID=A0AAD7QF12_QUISA|nr:alpha/beta-Hydrolases superfamily protein [Quillaja saponaria]